jgi:hypothetical protein
MSSTNEQVRWVRAWPDDDRPEFRIGRIGSDLVAEWPGFASLRTNRSGTQSEHRFIDPSIDPTLAAKFQRGQVAALLRHLRGGLSLHAAAAAKEGEGVVLLGSSQVGKSSTIAGLCRHRGAEFLADDIAAFVTHAGTFRVLPVETHHWLASDSIQTLGLDGASDDWDKNPIAPTVVAAAPARVAAIIKLEVDDSVTGPRLSPMRGRTVFEALSRSAIRFVVDEMPTALHDFETMAELAAQAPVYELRRPTGIEWLRPCVNVIGDLLDTWRAKGSSG